jgi:hypothetical protein
MRSVKQFAFPPQRHDNFCIFPDIIEAKGGPRLIGLCADLWTPQEIFQ